MLAKFRPQLLFLNYARLARQQGLNRPYFILSFDCDTELDIAVVEQLHAWLTQIGIQPVYAVPGQLLEKGIEVYRRIAFRGAEFMNHGYYVHTRYNSESRTYEGTFFYNKLSRKNILDDIQRGHDTQLALFGKAPLGFRIPHFGTFQRPQDLKFIYDTLKQLGYKYSSSTTPLYGFLHGPLSRVRGELYEIPVSGGYDNPPAILDSWGARYAPGRIGGEENYRQQFAKMLGFFQGAGRSGLLNYYVDPSQVYDWPVFFDCMKLAAPIAIKSYGQLLMAVKNE
jgi:hypothetical protein